MADRFSIAYEKLTDYTQAEEDAFAIVVASYPCCGVKIYNTTIQSVRIWNGTAFVNAPSNPSNNVFNYLNFS